jgi:hypothetical protein
LYIRSRRQCGNFQGACVSCSRRGALHRLRAAAPTAAVKDLFADWLARHFPDRKEKVLNRVRELRGGKLYDATWGDRMHGQGQWAGHIKSTFALHTARLGLNEKRYTTTAAHFRRPPPTPAPGETLPLFS